jgi:branched-chain amino acid transport system ATP-binding protein
MSSFLEVTELRAGYGPVSVLHGVSFTVSEGEIVAVLGANGAGKSTLMKSIVGLVPPSSGSVKVDGRELARQPTEKIVRSGMTLVPEGRDVFARLSVVENLRMGAFGRRDRAGIRRDLESLIDRFPRLGERSAQAAGTLSGGEQQQLAICRALMSSPRVLLLDEPSLGLAPLTAKTVFDLVGELRAERGLTIVLVEQSIHAALAIADRAFVMSAGSFVASGTSSEIAGAAHDLENSYLGRSA